MSRSSVGQESTKRRGSTSQRAPVVPVRDNVHFPQLISTLLVGRDISLRALQSAIQGNRMVLVISQNDVGIDEPSPNDLHRVGTLSEVVQVMPMPDGTMRVVLRGIARAKATSLTFRNGFYKANYDILLEETQAGADSEALRREAIESFQQIADLGKHIPVEVLEVLPSIDEVGHLADLLTDHLNLRPSVKQELLQELNAYRRLEKLVHLLTSERQVLKLQSDLRQRVEEELGNTQREYFLREQLKVIQNELQGEEAPFSRENEALADRIRESDLPEETQEKALQELRRLDRAPTSSPESLVIRTWLDWLLELPWADISQDRLDVKLAAEILEREHYGLQKVKDRILDFLAVRQLSGSLRGPILCFVGPPGVGKTSFGRAIAEALGRKFIRVSLGGVRDEAEIRGHRRTYIGSMPGRILKGIRQCGTRNPVFMLDEIDKLASDFRGDPTSALLEALDPEQNSAFSDHYIEAPFDLSAVMFIMTANMLEAIPPALRDRMEVIHFPSYTEPEKLHIAEDFLFPKIREEHGIKPDQIELTPKVYERLVRDYTREAGVRNLSREIATLCRKGARKLAEKSEAKVRVDESSMEEMLGKPRFRYGSKDETDEVGSTTGLVYTESGGDIVTIEVSLMPTIAQETKLHLTGSLGDVMKESAMTAISYIRSHQADFSEKEFRFDVHVHVPEGAAPKDGPSAGITIATALASAFSQRKSRKDLAMTGEVTLRGKVLPVGGIREKLLAAHRSGIFEVIVPQENHRDIDELPENVRKALQIHFVKNVDEVFNIALIKE